MIIYHVTCSYEVDRGVRHPEWYSSKEIYHSKQEAGAAMRAHMRKHNRHVHPDKLKWLYQMRSIDIDKVTDWERLFPVHETKKGVMIKS